MSASSQAHVSKLSLEGYVQLVDALTGGTTGAAVRAVSAIEEHFFRIQDLRNVLLAHGLNIGKFVRGDLLRAMVGQHLLDPTAAAGGGGTAVGGGNAAAAASPSEGQQRGAVDALPIQPADLIALGWAEGSAEEVQAAMQQAPVLSLPHLPGARMGAAGDDEATRPLTAAEAAPANAPTAAAVVADAASGSLAPPAAAAPPPAAAPMQPLDQHALLALLQQHGLLPAGVVAAPAAAPLEAPQKQQTAANQPATAVAAAAADITGPPADEEDEDEAGGDPEPEFEHTAWLRRQLAIFEGLPGYQSSGESVSEGDAAALAGRRVAFVLDREMEVVAGRGQQVLKLPAGLFQVCVWQDGRGWL